MVPKSDCGNERSDRACSGIYLRDDPVSTDAGIHRGAELEMRGEFRLPRRAPNNASNARRPLYFERFGLPRGGWLRATTGGTA